MGNAAELVKHFKLHRIMRYAVSGSLFLYAWHRGDPIDLDRITNTAVVFGAVGVALVVGIIVYSFHRAIINPVIERGIILCQGRISPRIWTHWNPYWTAASEMVLSISRWERRGDDDPRQRELDEWAGQIHLLYCSALALMAGNVFAMGWHVKLPIDWLLLLLVGGLFVAGVRGDFALHRYDEEVFKRRLEEQETASRASQEQSAG